MVGLVRRVLAALILGGALLWDLGPSTAWAPTAPFPAHHAGDGFRNLSPGYAYPLLGRAVRLVRRGLEPDPPRGPPPAPVPNDGAELRANGHAPTITWIGHSTFLVQLDGVNILTDPHWGDRASPLSFAGPRRLVPPGMRLEDLPPIDAVVISHDHYDHLDEGTVRRLALEHRATFFVPLGLRAWLADRGVREVVELDWWQEASFAGLTFVCTPAQHSSGRGLLDQNRTLWSSWVVIGAGRRLFFAGDTGYDPGLAAVGRVLGPFDLAVIPVGGYSAWPGGHPNHVSPEEAVQLFRDLRGRRLVPMHWGTFDMNREPFREPPERLLREAERHGLRARVSVLAPGQTLPW